MDINSEFDKNIETLRKAFFQEVKEIIEEASKNLLLLEADPQNEKLLDCIFRGIHTIKGSAGVYLLDDISSFTHHLEELLDELRERKISLTPEIVDVSLAGIGYISLMIEQSEKSGKAEINSELVEQFKSFLSVNTLPPQHQENEITPSKEKTETKHPAGMTSNGRTERLLDDQIELLPPDVRWSFQEAIDNGLNVFRVQLLLSSQMIEFGYNPLIFLKNLNEISKIDYAVISSEPVPPIREFKPLELYLKPIIFIATESSINDIIDLSVDPSFIDVHDLVVLSYGETEDQNFQLPDNAAINEFVECAFGWLETAEREIINYEQNNSPQALNELFRIIHNIKGDSSYLGLLELKTFSHAFESLLERLRSNQLAKTGNIIDVILKSLDFVKKCITHVAQKKSLPVLPPIFNTLQEYQKNNDRVAKPIVKESFLSEVAEELREVFIDQLFQYKEILLVNLKSISNSKVSQENIIRTFNFMLNASVYVGYASLSQLAKEALSQTEQGNFKAAVDNVLAYIENLEIEPTRLGEILVSQGKLDDKGLKEVLAQQKPIGEMLIEAGKVSRDDVDQALEKQKDLVTTQSNKAEAASEAEIRTMRIDEHKIEQFTNLAGELLIARNTYAFLLDQLANANGNAKEIHKSLKENLHLFSSLTNDLQHGIISLRMIPIGGIFQKFSRVVRDISRKQKKIIQLKTEGDDIEIDKKVADVLSDPMIHLIRNSCDHGLEAPSDRKNTGKEEKGTITLKASYEGSNLCIRVSDDGRGINREKLYEKALEHGVDVKSIDDPALLDVIFLPGVSTKSVVSEISGRGVGMDVVKTTVRSLGGTVKVTSEEKKGTEVFLSLPTSMGIKTVLAIECQGRPFAIPIDFVVETIKIPVEKIKNAGAQMMFYNRGEVITVKPLEDIFSTSGKNNKIADHQRKELAVVIINSQQGKFGLVVDCFKKNIELAIKPVPDVFKNIEIISGVSIMGDGKVLLVLNPMKF
jgi:two-component system, chemotaxis family, sensor kinase CheA